MPFSDDLAVDSRDTDRAARPGNGRQTGSQLADLFLKFVHDHVSQDRGYKGGQDQTWCVSEKDAYRDDGRVYGSTGLYSFNAKEGTTS
jgi:hypothetical protein